MLANVSGHEKVMANLLKTKNATHHQVRTAVGVTTQQVVNAAKANHGSNAHAVKRYENDTTLLTNSMQARIVQDDATAIVGQASANREYASDVELGTPNSRAYPYMYPALAIEGQRLTKNIQTAAKI